MNTITATIEFGFKGQQFVLDTPLDLDELMQKHNSIPPLYDYIAHIHNIDNYSYEYEILLGETIQFSHASTWVADFVENKHFDQVTFAQQWQERNILEKLAPKIKQLDIDDIQQHPQLKDLILTAYNYGKQAS